MAVFAGSTPKYLLKIKDEQGLQLDPTNTGVVSEVKVYLYNSITGADVGKFYLRTNPGTGWSPLSTKDLGGGDKRVLLALSAAQTQAAASNSNTIQVNVHVVDTEAPGGTRIVIKKGKFHEIAPAHS